MTKDGHALFLVKLFGPYDIPFSFADRYSSMLQFQDKVKTQLSIPADGLPAAFPAKKFFGATDPAFLRKRCEQMTSFFNGFLADPNVKNSPLIYGYFREKAADEASKETIDKFIAFLTDK